MNPVDAKSTHFDAETYAEQKCGNRDVISSPREKNLVIIAFIFGLLVLCLLCAIIMTIIIGVITPKQEYCLSTHCVKKAGSILRIMNRTANPCNDFYTFACGGWVEEYDVDEDSETAVLGKMQMKINRKFDKTIKRIKSSVEEAKQTGKDRPGDISETAVKAINTYESCFDLYNNYDLNNIIPFMNEFGGWPMAQKDWSNNGTLQIENKLAAVISSDAAPFFKIGLEPIEDDPTRNILIISLPPTPTLSLGNSSDFLAMIKTISKKLGGEEAKIDQDISDFSDLTAAIKEKLESASASDDFEKVTIGQLGTILKGMTIDWGKLFTVLLKPEIGEASTTAAAVTTDANSTPINNPTSTDGSNHDSNEFSDVEVIVRDKEIINKILKLIGVKQTDRVLHNYLAIHVLLNHPLLIVKDFQQISGNQETSANNQETSANLEKDLNAMKANCLEIVSKYLNYAMDHVFIYQRIKPTRKAKDLISYIKKSFRRLIEQYTWLDTETRKPLLTKLLRMNSFIDYPPWIGSKEKVDDFYKNYKFDNSSAVAAYFNMIRFAVRKFLGTYSETNNRDKWPYLPFLSISTVNAFYIPYQNNFILPRAILNPPIYDEDNPMYLTFGSIGAVIGHEITHGFDAKGRYHDEIGRKASFWSPVSTDSYERLSQCFVEQYGKYEVDKETKTKVNGTTTLSENIADNGGLRESFKAYRLWLKEVKNGKTELPLPGLGEYNSEQMFFISFGQTWCVSAGKNYLIRQVKTDEHTPNNYRVIGTLSNMEEFSQAFRCTSSSEMNPKDKCVLW